jgi:hypothetical protein
MRLEYVFDYPSPYAYLASTRLKTLGIDAEHTPIDILTVMKAVNNQPTPACPPKARYTAMDWAQKSHSSCASGSTRVSVPLAISAARSGSLSSGYRWFESSSLQRRVVQTFGSSYRRVKADRLDTELFKRGSAVAMGNGAIVAFAWPSGRV